MTIVKRYLSYETGRRQKNFYLFYIFYKKIYKRINNI